MHPMHFGNGFVLMMYCRYRCSYLKPKLKRHRYSGSLEVQSEDSFKINEQMELIPKSKHPLKEVEYSRVRHDMYLAVNDTIYH